MASIWRDIHSVWCLHALKPSTRFERGPGQVKEPLAGMAHSPPSCLLIFPSSSCSHSVILTVILKIHCKSPGTTFIILPGTPESQGPLSLQISGVPGPALGCPSGPQFCYLFRAPDWLYFPVRAHKDAVVFHSDLKCASSGALLQIVRICPLLICRTDEMDLLPADVVRKRALKSSKRSVKDFVQPTHPPFCT